VFSSLLNTNVSPTTSDTVTNPDSPLGFWDEELWISKNKKYPASRCRVTIGSTIRSLANPSSLHQHSYQMLAFNKWLIEGKSTSTIISIDHYSTSGAFAKMNQMKTWLPCSAHIPPRTWLQQLEVAFWAGMVWWCPLIQRTTIQIVMTATLGCVVLGRVMQMPWEAISMAGCCGWVNRWGKEKELAHEADCVHEMMTSLSWELKSVLLVPTFQKSNSTRLLSTAGRWRNYRLMMFELSTQAKFDPELFKTTMVATLNLSMNINRAFDTGNYYKKSWPLLAPGIQGIQMKRNVWGCTSQHMLTPNHWVPYFINLTRRPLIWWVLSIMMTASLKWGLGDSRAHLDPKPPQKACNWKANKKKSVVAQERICGKEFTCEGIKWNTENKRHCKLGVYHRNTTSMELFGVEILTHGKRCLARMQWFIRLARAQLEHVSYVLLVRKFWSRFSCHFRFPSPK